MASILLTPRSGLAHVMTARAEAARDEPAGVTLSLRQGCALAMVSARKHRLDALMERVRESFGLMLPQERKRAAAGPIAFVWAGPGQWLATAENEDGATFEQRLRAARGEAAAVSDLSDGRTILRVSGERARDVLAKGVPIDLHPSVFRTNDVAATIVAHIAVHLWQVDETPAYDLVVPRSFAISFWEWLGASSAEFGFRTGNEAVS
jgi:methylglutamate dehydrogenase subunit D